LQLKNISGTDFQDRSPFGGRFFYFFPLNVNAGKQNIRQYHQPMIQIIKKYLPTIFSGTIFS
jgi:hypothetical protein